MAKPVVEMDGDEMTRIIWQFIKEKVGPAQASWAPRQAPAFTCCPGGWRRQPYFWPFCLPFIASRPDQVLRTSGRARPQRAALCGCQSLHVLPNVCKFKAGPASGPS